ncbi:MAG: hypothetical protein J3K34DRAFT_418176 [Monoraphidium minutum]|nr:MAG: hypothetical protein J3K34DRAFT_418176 [Monoraphidium minutum]
MRDFFGPRGLWLCTLIPRSWCAFRVSWGVGLGRARPWPRDGRGQQPHATFWPWRPPAAAPARRPIHRSRGFRGPPCGAAARGRWGRAPCSAPRYCYYSAGSRTHSGRVAAAARNRPIRFDPRACAPAPSAALTRKHCVLPPLVSSPAAPSPPQPVAALALVCVRTRHRKAVRGRGRHSVGPPPTHVPGPRPRAL